MNKDLSNKDITHVKNNELEYLTFNILNKYSDKLTHSLFLKHGGVSEGIYSSLNLRIASKDLKSNVFENYKIAMDEFGIYEVYKAKQNHTDNILILDNNNKEKYELDELNKEEYDAYVTNVSGIPSVITTADCNPIIIYDPVQNVVANIHSGWKGTIKQIYLKTAVLMNKKFNCEFKDMIVCIGPSINKCCFTSKDKEFKELFANVWSNEEDYIYYANEKYHIDLGYVIKQDLVELGINEDNIVLSNICTVCNSDKCFSYRMSLKNNDGDYAVMGCFVNLK